MDTDYLDVSTISHQIHRVRSDICQLSAAADPVNANVSDNISADVSSTLAEIGTQISCLSDSI